MARRRVHLKWLLVVPILSLLALLAYCLTFMALVLFNLRRRLGKLLSRA